MARTGLRSVAPRRRRGSSSFMHAGRSCARTDGHGWGRGDGTCKPNLEDQGTGLATWKREIAAGVACLVRPAGAVEWFGRPVELRRQAGPPPGRPECERGSALGERGSCEACHRTAASCRTRRRATDQERRSASFDIIHESRHSALGRLRSRRLCAHVGRAASLPMFPGADITSPGFAGRDGRIADLQERSASIARRAAAARGRENEEASPTATGSRPCGSSSSGPPKRRPPPARPARRACLPAGRTTSPPVPRRAPPDAREGFGSAVNRPEGKRVGPAARQRPSEGGPPCHRRPNLGRPGAGGPVALPGGARTLCSRP